MYKYQNTLIVHHLHNGEREFSQKLLIHHNWLFWGFPRSISYREDEFDVNYLDELQDRDAIQIEILEEDFVENLQQEKDKGL